MFWLAGCPSNYIYVDRCSIFSSTNLPCPWQLATICHPGTVTGTVEPPGIQPTGKSTSDGFPAGSSELLPEHLRGSLLGYMFLFPHFGETRPCADKALAMVGKCAPQGHLKGARVCHIFTRMQPLWWHLTTAQIIYIDVVNGDIHTVM